MLNKTVILCAKITQQYCEFNIWHVQEGCLAFSVFERVFFFSFYVAVPRSILRPTWDWRTKPESRDFNEFNHILQESKKLGKALENLSRSEWTDNYPVRNSYGRLIYTARTDTDRLQQTLQQVFSDQCVTPCWCQSALIFTN